MKVCKRCNACEKNTSYFCSFCGENIRYPGRISKKDISITSTLSNIMYNFTYMYRSCTYRYQYVFYELSCTVCLSTVSVLNIRYTKYCNKCGGRHESY